MESKTKLRWATLGVGVIGHQLADAMQALGGNLYAVGNRTHEKAVAFAKEYGIGKVYDHPEDNLHFYFWRTLKQLAFAL